MTLYDEDFRGALTGCRTLLNVVIGCQECARWEAWLTREPESHQWRDEDCREGSTQQIAHYK